MLHMSAIYRKVGNFLAVIFLWISIINHIHGEKFVVSESIIANHSCHPLLVGKKICGFVLATKSTKYYPSKMSRYKVSSHDTRISRVAQGL